MVCEICGRTYHREQCEYCAREAQWCGRIEEKALSSTFTPRQIEVLRKHPKNVFFDNSLYLHGVVDTGKTILAAQYLRGRMKKDFIESRKNTYRFVNVLGFLFLLRQTYQDNQQSDYALVQELCTVDYLVFDEIGADKVSDWALQILYLIINTRYEQKKSTIITSNYDLSELAQTLSDERITRRIYASYDIIELTRVWNEK